MNNKFLVGALVVIALLVSGLYFKGSNLLGATGTRMPNGISADTTSPVAGEVRGTTLTITSTSAFTGLLSAVTGAFSGVLTTNAGMVRSYSVASTTSATAETMLIAQLAGYDTILLTPDVGALTITLPATSTAATWIPAVGDMQETCFYNATGTAAATITFVAGSGIDWESVATSSPISVINVPPAIPARGHGCFKFIRTATTGAATDISALYTVYGNGD